MTAEDLIQELENVRRTRPGSWVARCPGHQDRDPSLSIRQAADRVLLHCFAGCGAADVLAALGLGWSDLFQDNEGRTGCRARPKIPTPRDRLREWGVKTARRLRDEHLTLVRIERIAERCLDRGDPGGWDLFRHAHRDRGELEWLLDLLDFGDEVDLAEAKAYLERSKEWRSSDCPPPPSES
jgi:hypothetical protein